MIASDQPSAAAVTTATPTVPSGQRTRRPSADAVVPSVSVAAPRNGPAVAHVTPLDEQRAVVDDRVCWSTVAGLSLIHLAGVVGVIWIVLNPSAATIALAASLYVVCGMSITAGYHRLFAHRTYRASPPVRWGMLAFGAATFQNSALSWSADHRAHHRTRTELLTPAVTRGVWFAHVGWLFRRRRIGRRPTVEGSLGRAQHPATAPLVPGRGDRYRAASPDGCGLHVGGSVGWTLRRGLPSDRRHAAGNVLHQLARPPRREQALRRGPRPATAR